MLHSKFTRYSKKTKKGGVFLQIFNFIISMESYKKKGFDIISTNFRLIGSNNLRFDYFQIFEYIRIYLWIFVFVTKGVKNIIRICIRIICFLLRILFIFVFVHKKYYSLHSIFKSLKLLLHMNLFSNGSASEQNIFKSS